MRNSAKIDFVHLCSRHDPPPLLTSVWIFVSIKTGFVVKVLVLLMCFDSCKEFTRRTQKLLVVAFLPASPIYRVHRIHLNRSEPESPLKLQSDTKICISKQSQLIVVALSGPLRASSTSGRPFMRMPLVVATFFHQGFRLFVSRTSVAMRWRTGSRRFRGQVDPR